MRCNVFNTFIDIFPINICSSPTLSFDNIYSYKCDINVTSGPIIYLLLDKGLYITPRTVTKFEVFIIRHYLHVILVPRFHPMYKMSYCESNSFSTMVTICRKRC